MISVQAPRPRLLAQRREQAHRHLQLGHETGAGGRPEPACHLFRDPV
jgi:hypothetical protein